MSRTLNSIGQAAVKYCELGFGIFPCVERGKRPAMKHGLNDWFDDPKGAAELWEEYPDFNVGITCGEPSGGLVVIDIDRKPGADGWETLKRWEREHGELPETVTATTGSGGKHLYYRAMGERVAPSVNQELGVDIRGEGSYVVAPPSVHECGSLYEWDYAPWEDGAEIADADANVMAFISFVRPTVAAGGTDGESFVLPETIGKGGRDNILYKYACSLRAKGYEHAQIRTIVAAENIIRCKPPLTDAEIDRICGSACKHAPGLSPEYAAKATRKQAEAVSAETEADAAEADEEIPNFRKGGKPNGAIIPNILARIVMERHLARYIDGAPAVWTGRRWEYGDRAIAQCVLNLADDAKKADRSEIVSYIHTKAPSVSSDNSFDGRYYVSFKNGAFDVMEGCFVEPNPSMYITYTLPVELDLEQGPNEADEFLRAVSGGDADVMQALAEVIGACMCPKRILSQAAMLIGRAGGAKGKASNGKSTYLNWVRAILGTENVSSLDIATLGQRFQAGRIVGKAANLGDDIPDGFLRADELSIFKKLVTGDSIYTDVKNSEGFEFRSSATVVFSMNSVPRLSDTTDGIFRRLGFIPFRANFRPGTPGYDPHIAEKLARPEVLRRGALIGLMALHGLIASDGLLHPVPDMVAEVEEVRQDNDSVLRWIADCGISDTWLQGRSVGSAYKAYTDWCEESGERSPYSRRSWVTKLKESVDRLTLLTLSDCAQIDTASKYNSQTGKNERVFVMFNS